VRRRGLKYLSSVFLLAVAACCGSESSAATYYVRRSGNDNSSGTSPSAAWQTLSKAAQTLVASDTVYVGAGVYSESLAPVNDGTAAAPIRFVADSSGAMTGDAGNVDVNTGGSVVLVNQADYVQIIGFRVYGGTRGVEWRLSTGGLLDSCELFDNSNSGIGVEDSALTVQNAVIRNNTTNGMLVKGQSIVAVKMSRIYANGDGVSADSTDMVLTLDRCRIYANGVDGIHAERGTVTILNCLIYSNADDGIELTLGSPNTTIWNTTVADNGDDGVYVQTGVTTIKNSIVAFNKGDGLERQAGVMTHTHNIVSGNSGLNFAGTSASTGEIIGDPKFVSLSAGDFHLLTGSPAINTGTGAAGIVDVDIESYPRPMNLFWDMGCHEYLGIGAPGVRVIKWVEVK
jgi:hypothetical protein